VGFLTLHGKLGPYLEGGRKGGREGGRDGGVRVLWTRRRCGKTMEEA